MFFAIPRLPFFDFFTMPRLPFLTFFTLIFYSKNAYFYAIFAQKLCHVEEIPSRVTSPVFAFTLTSISYTRPN